MDSKPNDGDNEKSDSLRDSELCLVARRGWSHSQQQFLPPLKVESGLITEKWHLYQNV